MAHVQNGFPQMFGGQRGALAPLSYRNKSGTTVSTGGFIGREVNYAYDSNAQCPERNYDQLVEVFATGIQLPGEGSCRPYSE